MNFSAYSNSLYFLRLWQFAPIENPKVGFDSKPQVRRKEPAKAPPSAEKAFLRRDRDEQEHDRHQRRDRHAAVPRSKRGQQVGKIFKLFDFFVT